MKPLFARTVAVVALSAAPLFAGATTFQFNAQLNSANEVRVPPVVTAATGVATLFYNNFNTASLLDDTYDFALSAFGLSGVATAFHIHGLATIAQNAPVRVSLDAAPFVNLNPGGILLVGGNDVSPPAALITAGNGFPAMSFLDALQAGLTYVNVHTGAFSSGEIRGQLIQVAAIPEPGAYAMMLAGLGLVGFMWRRRVAHSTNEINT